jgi:putative aldouronate transport system permease protein
MVRKSKLSRMPMEDKLLVVTIYALLVVLCFTMLYPFWNSLVLSFNDSQDTARGGVTFWPREFTLENYRYVFQNPRIPQAFMITVLRTAVGTVGTITITSLLAFALSKKELRFRNLYMILCVVTMYFHGGLIPRYMVLRSLGLFNTFWVMVIPVMVNVFYMIIFRSFFRNLPSSLEESAEIDGAGYYVRFFRIVMPVSKPVFAALILFVAVFHWNQWFDAAIFIQKRDLMPIQTLLRQIIHNNAASQLAAEIGGQAAEQIRQNLISTKSLQMSTMMVATIPIILVYPFLQRYFVAGIMIGSLKG